MSSEDSSIHEEVPSVIYKTIGQGKLIVAILIAFVLGGFVVFELLAGMGIYTVPSGEARVGLSIGEYQVIRPLGISPDGYMYALLAHGDPGDPSNFRLHRLPSLWYPDLCSGCILKIYDEDKDDGKLTLEIWPPPEQDRPIPILPAPPPIFDSI